MLFSNNVSVLESLWVPLPGRVLGLAGWSFEQSPLVASVPAHVRRVGAG